VNASDSPRVMARHCSANLIPSSVRTHCEPILALR
jgi:hypothetical protein